MKSKEVSELEKKIKRLDIKNDFDFIVAVSRGGINPAKLLAKELKLKIEIIKINYRDNSHSIIYDKPKLLEEIDFKTDNKKILLVDDVIKTGHTISLAKQKMTSCRSIKTFVINGSADYSLYNEDCFKVNW